MSSSDSEISDEEFGASRFVGFSDPNRVSKRQRSKNSMLGVFNDASDSETNNKEIKTAKKPLRFQSLAFAKASVSADSSSVEPSNFSKKDVHLSDNDSRTESGGTSSELNFESINGDENLLSRQIFEINSPQHNGLVKNISSHAAVRSPGSNMQAFNPYIINAKSMEFEAYSEKNQDTKQNKIRLNHTTFLESDELSIQPLDPALKISNIRSEQKDLKELDDESEVIKEISTVIKKPNIGSEKPKLRRRFNPMAFNKPKFNATAFSEVRSADESKPETVKGFIEEDRSHSPLYDSNLDFSPKPMSRFASPDNTPAPLVTPMPAFKPTENNIVPISVKSTMKELSDKGRMSARDRHSSPYGLGAKLLARMGHVAGKGLGAGGSGMVNPIEQKLRPQGLGLGGIKERTKQAIEEARRRGENVSDSEDEGSSKFRKKNDTKRKNTLKKMNGDNSEIENPAVLSVNRKTRKSRNVYKTISEMEKEGLKITPALRSIIDLTGKSSKTLDDLDNFSSVGSLSANEVDITPLFNLTEQVTDEIEKYGKEWDLLKIRKNYKDFEKNQLSKELNELNSDISRLESLLELTAKIEKSNANNETSDLSEISDMLQQLELEYPNEFEKFNLEELAIAAFAPLIESNNKNWNPLKYPSFLFTEISGLKRMISFNKDLQDSSQTGYLPQQNNLYHEEFLNGDSFIKRASLFDSMMAQSWLPQVRLCLINEWNCYHPASAILLIEQWDQVLPSFIRWLLLNQVIFPKLKLTLSDWNPRSSSFTSKPVPHKWIFPWLPYFKFHSSASNIQKRIIEDAKQKFGSVLRRWKLSNGQNNEIIAELSHWKEIFGINDFDSLLIKNILGLISDYLRRNLIINPADQDLKVINTVLGWGKLFKPMTMALLLKEELFPKWHATLHTWLTSSAGGHERFEEINEWYAQWHDLFPQDITGLSIIKDEFSYGLQTIDRALDLFVEDRLEELPQHIGFKSSSSSSITDTHSVRINNTPTFSVSKSQIQMTFKDVVEDFCINNDLFLISLRQAHPTLGHALYKISASPTGHGGLLCYLSEDVVWVQDNKMKEYQPTSLDSISNILSV
ncbi:TFP11-domain-containing protein [Nadsonia fulvescens var. elongata DSM 6958]|uniref:TFP11-domain-containing protein n=1 Tax=Nadsonia fulvescens var. elongata DSM 6958 TaxID=857566 RepID=A0A1E3PMK6_9ASCO|nr:TFP11-domain-containing protein [Nadsonia fulvescens var. elongata DSM 6958]